jgi:hypothetical protein
MADKVDKPKKKAKSKKDEKGVLAALPSTRPERIGGRRSAASSAPAPKTTTATGASKAAAKPAAAAKRSTAAKAPAASAKRSTTAATARPKAGTSRAKAATSRAKAPRAKAARPKAAAPRTFEPTQAAESAAGAADERAAGAIPLSETPRKRAGGGTYPRPRPVREGAPGIGTAGYRDHPDEESGRPSGVELATSAVRAAGEVAQLGLAIGGHVLKRVVDRLPKP